MDNIPEIRDIHIPDGVSIFPLAYGWWIILIGLVCLFLIVKLLIWGIKTSKKYYALNKLKKISVSNPIIGAVQISELLRRICHVKFKTALALYGSEWIDFLNQHSSVKLTDDSAKLLIYAPFMDQESTSYSQQTAENLKAFCRQWIGENL